MNLTENIWLAFLLTISAGLFTGVGSIIAYFIKKPKMSYLSFSLGLSAGVMIYISFMELLPEAFKAVGRPWSLLAFFIGIGLMIVIDLLIPEAEHPDHFEKLQQTKEIDPTLMRTGLITAFAIGLHNFPEGLATFAAALNNTKLGIFIAFAIAIHNIPEGISVSMPIFYATKNKNKAFVYSFFSGMSEPIGAAIGFFVLMPFLSEALIASLLALIAGIMVYISVDELLPMAHRYGHSHTVIAGIVLGMLVMALSLLML